VWWELAMVLAAVVFLMLLGMMATAKLFFHHAAQGTALVRSGWTGTRASCSVMFVIPPFHRLQHLDLTLKPIRVVQWGQDALVSKDNIRLDAKIVFMLRVPAEPEAISRVAEWIGCERTFDEEVLGELFRPKFTEVLVSTAKELTFEEIYHDETRFKQEVMRQLEPELIGYTLEDVVLDHLARPASDDSPAEEAKLRQSNGAARSA